MLDRCWWLTTCSDEDSIIFAPRLAPSDETENEEEEEEDEGLDIKRVKIRGKNDDKKVGIATDIVLIEDTIETRNESIWLWIKVDDAFFGLVSAACSASESVLGKNGSMAIEHDDDKVARAVMALAKKSRDDAETSSVFWARINDAAPSAMINISGILSLNDAGKCSP